MVKLWTKPTKLYYSIREVAQLLDVKESQLRYWEKKFPTVQPQKTDKGTRQYTDEDIDAIRLVHHLVKEKGLTLAGAKQKLKDNKDNVIQTKAIISRLKTIRAELEALKKELEGLGVVDD